MTDSIKQAACRWFTRLRSDAHTEQDTREHRDWLQADPLHGEAHKELDEIWQLTGDFADRPELLAMRQNALQSFRSKTADNQMNTTPDISRRGFRAKYWAPVALAAGLVVFVFSSDLLNTFFQPVEAHETITGEQRQVALEDGTMIMLDTQTRIVTRYSDARRTVVLEKGQARFDVAKDASRQFVVEAGNGEITALGTAFVVNKTNSNIVVTLLEGKVAVTQDAPKTNPDTTGQPTAPTFDLQLQAGQQVAYSKSSTGITTASAVNIEKVTAWQQGRLIFEDDTLNEVLKGLNRYSKTKILIGDESLKPIKITGVFKTGDNGKAVNALQAYFPVRVINDRSGNLVLLRDRQ